MAEGITSGVCEAEARWSAKGEDSGGVSESKEHVTKTLPHPPPLGRSRKGGVAHVTGEERNDTNVCSSFCVSLRKPLFALLYV